jgi:hypothetical protein
LPRERSSSDGDEPWDTHFGDLKPISLCDPLGGTAFGSGCNVAVIDEKPEVAWTSKIKEES